ncbi:MAG: phosphatase PAP2 family protein [Saprospiraceae bacterium]
MTSSIFFSYRSINLTLFLIFSINLFGQSPYEISYKKDVPLLAGAVIGNFLGARFINNNLSPFTVSEIGQLDRQNINRFDRIAIDNYSSSARALSDVLLYSTFSYPALILLDKPIRKDYFKIGILAVESLGWTITVTTLTKGLTKRTRPFMYNPAIPFEDKIDSNGRLSFFSGHTAGVASISFFTAKVLNDYYPNSKWKSAIWSVASIIPVTTGYLRIRSGKHYPTDVLTGLIVGGAIGILIPHFHKKKKKKASTNLSLLPSGNGLGIVLVW